MQARIAPNEPEAKKACGRKCRSRRRDRAERDGQDRRRRHQQEQHVRNARHRLVDRVQRHARLGAEATDERDGDLRLLQG